MTKKFKVALGFASTLAVLMGTTPAFTQELTAANLDEIANQENKGDVLKELHVKYGEGYDITVKKVASEDPVNPINLTIHAVAKAEKGGEDDVADFKRLPVRLKEIDLGSLKARAINSTHSMTAGVWVGLKGKRIEGGKSYLVELNIKLSAATGELLEEAQINEVTTELK